MPMGQKICLSDRVYMISVRSKITQKLLGYLFLHNAEELYVNELLQTLDVDKRNLVKKLNELEGNGLLKSRTRGNMRLYSINKKFPLFKEYERIFLKTVGVEEKLRKILNGQKGVREAYIYGSYPQGKLTHTSDIDVMVIGSHSSIALQNLISGLQREINREINVVDMDKDEFDKRKKKKDPFLLGVLKKKNIKLI